MTYQACYCEFLYLEAGGAEADASSRNLFGSPLKRSSPFQGPLSERRRHAAHNTCIIDNMRVHGQRRHMERGGFTVYALFNPVASMTSRKPIYLELLVSSKRRDLLPECP